MGELIKEHDQIATGEQYPIATSSRRGLFPQSEYFDGKRAGDNKKMEFHVVPDGYVTYRLMSDDSVFHFNQNLTGAPIQVSKEYPVFTAKPGTNMGFVVYNLNHSDSFKKFSHIRKKGGTRVRLYLKVLKAYLISIPGNAEQDQIASFFCILDSTIALHQRQLDQLHALKQELLKRLFPQYGNQHPQIRFTGFDGNWKQRKFGELLKEFSKRSTVENEYTVLSSTTLGMEIRDGRVSGVSNIGYKIIKDGDLVLSPQNLWLGNININSIGIGLVSPSYKTFQIVGVNQNFLASILKSAHMLNAYRSASTQGASVVRRNLNIAQFHEITVKIPSKREQEMIGNLFLSLTKTVAIHQQKLYELKKIKRTLLQRMLI